MGGGPVMDGFGVKSFTSAMELLWRQFDEFLVSDPFESRVVAVYLKHAHKNTRKR
jgi:hypothetical protein